MKIRTKLSITFILLLIFGVTAISSYSILFIRGYLLEQAVYNLEQDARWMSLSLEGVGKTFEDQLRLARISSITGYHISVYQHDGTLITEYPENTLPSGIGMAENSRTGDGDDNSDGISNQSEQLTIQTLRISTLRETIYEPVKTIRWIIYTGMFISIGLILIVSFTFAGYMARPIMQLTGSSKRIASGDVDHKIDINRADEFGVLAESINQMASTLRADNEQLMKIYERQQEFIADIAHEIRNPLHTILGSIEMLELDNLPEEKRKNYLENTKNQAERISSLFKDLILLQRSVSDDHFLTPRVFDLSSVTTRIENVYKEKLAGRNLEFSVEKQFCKVYGDPARIEQVLDNLISNAEKYTSDGYIRLGYTVLNGKVRISVEDSGIGIPPEHHAYLFNRFYRTDKARSRDSGGAGLGLAVVKSIIDAHQTSIHVDSKPGKGTKFYFDLGKRPAAEQTDKGNEIYDL
ncbi:MAG: HAMP domain-containing histidine kinase [Rhodothermaceae bacterium]|nr:HAMP domain-containing histidine kinase [Rhodothermaceae bacterium]